MLIPFSTDKTDSFIGYGAVGILVACLVGFLAVWPAQRTFEERLFQESVPQWDLSEEEMMGGDSAIGWDVEKNEPAPDQVEALTRYRERMLERSRQAAEEGAQRMRERVAKEAPYWRFGLYPAGGRWFPGMIVYMFLHAGWMHLIGNLLFFFAFGVAIEHRFGRGIFLGLFLGGGMFAGLAHVFAYAGLHHGRWPEVPLVGASGAVAVMMGAFLRCYPSGKVKIFVWFLRPRIGQLPAWVFLGTWIFLEFLQAHFLLPLQHTGGGTAYMAHVAGFFLGFLVAPFLPVTEEIRELERPRGPRGLSVGDRPRGVSLDPLPPSSPQVPPGSFPGGGNPPQASSSVEEELGWWLKSNRNIPRFEEIWKRRDDVSGSIAPAPLLYECGMHLVSQEAPADLSRSVLEATLLAQPGLSEGLQRRVRDALAVLPSSDDRSGPPPSSPPSAPPPSSRRGAPGGPERPSWLVD